MLDFLRKIEQYFVKIEIAVLVAILLMMIFLAFSQVILRNFFNYSFIWADVLVRLAVLWVAILGASIATTEKGHIKMDIFNRLLPEPYDEYLDAGLSLVAAFITGFFVYYSWKFVAVQKEVGSTLDALHAPEWIFGTIFPVGFFGMMSKFVLRFFHDIEQIEHGQHELGEPPHTRDKAHKHDEAAATANSGADVKPAVEGGVKP